MVTSMTFQNLPKHVPPSRNCIFPLSLGSRSSSPVAYQACCDQTPGLPSSFISTTPFSNRHTPTRLNYFQFLKHNACVLISGSLPVPLPGLHLSHLFTWPGHPLGFQLDVTSSEKTSWPLSPRWGPPLRSRAPQLPLKWPFDFFVSMLCRELCEDRNCDCFIHH